MGKVKVTKNQADILYKVAKLVEGIPASKVISALENGYEVEPEFEEGDWVVVDSAGAYLGADHTQKITKIDKRRHFLEDGYWSFSSQFRHATPVEIAKEKERRFFAENGREPWELKKKDTLINIQNRKDLFVIGALNGNIITGYSFITEEYEDLSISDAKENFIVFCFAEDRKDA